MTTIIACTPRPNKLQMLRLSLVPGLRWRSGQLPIGYNIDCDYLFLMGEVCLAQGNIEHKPVCSFKDFMSACYGGMKSAGWEQEDI